MDFYGGCEVGQFNYNLLPDTILEKYASKEQGFNKKT